MDKLLQPDIGLMIWTWVTFLLLLLVLTKAAWKPILNGIHEREGKIRGDLERAEKAQAEAETLRQKYETQLAEAQRTIQDMVIQAKKDADRTRSELVSAAKEESEKILEKGRKDLAGETERLKIELRKDVAALSLSVAEKVLSRVVDKKVHEQVFHESLEMVGEVKR